jgi:hypothetical protein
MSMRGTFFAAAVATAISAPSLAWSDDASSKPSDTASGCDKFAWPIAHERDVLSTDMPLTPSGTRIFNKDKSFHVDLKLEKKTDFFLPPERQPKAGTYSGDITIRGVEPPGIYQVTLSDEAWVDVFENGVRLKSMAFTGAKDCPNVRKSVRFDLAPGAPVTIQISNSPKDSIKVALAPASSS